MPGNESPFFRNESISLEGAAPSDIVKEIVLPPWREKIRIIQLTYRYVEDYPDRGDP